MSFTRRAAGLGIAVTVFFAVAMMNGVCRADAESLTIPSLRVGLGAGITMQPGPDEGFMLDVTAGIRSFPAESTIIAADLGYSHFGGEVAPGHAASLVFAASIVPIGSQFHIGPALGVVVGRQVGEFAWGLRGGLRLDWVLGIVSLDCHYEWRRGSFDSQGLRALISVDPILLGAMLLRAMSRQ